ncbi:Protein NHX-2 [Aphelenchoides avenae]|nr:Protein NHX-2 [Aphelenchus avenae]
MGRLKRFTKVDEFIIAFGGLRGAIAYGLVVALPDEIPAKNLFVTSCIVVIYFTVFLQGMTLKPIANFLQVEKKASYDKGMIDFVYENALDNTMTGIELIMGRYGHQRWRSIFEKLNNNVLVPLLAKKEASKQVGQSNLVRAADRLAEQEATMFAETMEAWYHSRRQESQP